MSMRRLGLAVCVLLAGCKPGQDNSYFPLAPGARWTYTVQTDADGAASRHQQSISVLDERRFDGQPLYIRRSETPGNIGIEYWMRARPEGIVRNAQRMDLDEHATLDPAPRTVLKLPLALGASWRAPTAPYTVMRKNAYPREAKYGRGMLMSYTVEALEEQVTVPAGSFEHCARVVGRAELTLFTDPVRGFNKVPVTTTEWYCRGIGLVKLERIENLATTFYSGGRVTMELAAYTMP
ncbi:MAG: hypothetical protein ABWY05_11460 [Noviherbaspirillum sp.]